MNRGVLGTVLLGIVLVGVVVYMKVQRRADVGDDAKAHAMSILAEVENYSANQKFYEPRVKLAHLAAMDAAYKVGGRRQKSTFDADVYLFEFFEHLIKQARDEGRQEIVKSLIKLRDDKNITRPSGS